MKKTTLKNIGRDIFSSFSRFIAIFAITALGAGFFAGLSAVGPDMEATADEYYSKTKLMDFSLLSSMGFTSEDVTALRAQTDVSAVEPAHRLDFLADLGNGEEVFRFHSLPQNHDADNSGYLSQLTLAEGRLPENPGECVLGSTAYTQANIDSLLGSTITILPKNDEDSLEMLKTTAFTIVGTVRSPRYVTKFLGTTSLGTGNLSNYLYISEDDFNSEVYTELLLTVNKDNVAGFNTDAYKTLVEEKKASLETFGETRAQVRYDEIYVEAKEKLDEGQTEYDEGMQDYLDGKKEAEQQFADAQKEIDDNTAKLKQAKADIETGQAEIASASQTITNGWNEVNENEKTLSDSRSTLTQKESEYAAGLQQYWNNLALYQQNKAAYDSAAETIGLLSTGVSALPQQLAYLDQAYAGLPDTAENFQSTAEGILQTLGGASVFFAQSADAAPLKAQLDGIVSGYQAIPQDENYYTNAYTLLQNTAALQPAMEQGLSGAKAALTEQAPALAEAAAQLDAAKATLDSANSQLQQGWGQLEDGEAQLANAKAQLVQGQADLEAAREKLRSGEAELTDGETKLQEGKETLAAERKKADKELAEAHEKLAEAKTELDDGRETLADLENPKWYVFTRESGTSGYSGYWADIQRISAIARVITPFFFLVAALVCLTTMTRMVEEERTEIGTKKALGYSKFAIAFKYIFYAGFACLSGAAVGIFAGLQLFPKVIFDAYRILYSMPDLTSSGNWGIALFSAGISVVCIMTATVAACYSELFSVPSELMRPKAPAAGKRVLLERIPPLWNRLTFSWKVTIRNLFRNKRRFLMTIIGVLGCTALVVTGFGLRDCISGIAPIQYGGIYRYDYEITLMDSADPAADSSLNTLLPEIGEALYIQTTSVNPSSAKASSINLDTSLVVLQDNAAIVEDFITLRNRKTQSPLAPTEDGVVVSEKLATKLQLQPGDILHLKTTETDGTEKQGDFPVIGIAENYVGHMVYMSGTAYQKGFGLSPEYNGVRVLMAPASADTSDEAQKALRDSYLEKLVETDNVAAAVDISVIMDNVDDMLSSLNAVVWLILGSAALLAFVVLYNLTNINITERMREIATLKVLGFYDREVSSYIYRENILLTLIGIAIGLFAGRWLTIFVMTAAEIDDVMFRLHIEPVSFLLSIAITLGITLFVNLVMEKRLRSVDMVESLKSAE